MMRTIQTERFMRNQTMLKFKLAKPMLVALAACAASVAMNSVVFADDAQAQAQALKDQMRIMQQQMQDMQKKIDALSQQAAQQAQQAAQQTQQAQQAAQQAQQSAQQAQKAAQQAAPSAQGPTVAQQPPAEPKFEKFMKGFFGTLDVSLDDTSKGIRGLTAYSYSYNGAGPPPGTGIVNNGP